MSYHNPYSVVFDILRATDTISVVNYDVSSHGDLGATYNSEVNADLPEYAHGFYGPSQHEQFSDVKYSKLEIGYQKDLKEIHDAIAGIPLEFYTPQSVIIPEGGSTPTPVEVIGPKKMDVKEMLRNAAEEILKAQQEVVGIEVKVEQVFAQRVTIKKFLKKKKKKKNKIIDISFKEDE